MKSEEASMVWNKKREQQLDLSFRDDVGANSADTECSSTPVMLTGKSSSHFTNDRAEPPYNAIMT